MIIAFVVVLASILVLSSVLLLIRGRLFASKDLGDLASQLRPIDVNAFRNLIDEREEQFLRERLPPPDFRRIHRERMLAAGEYVAGAARNAGILIRLAESASHDPDPAVVAAAQSLQENAFRLRLYALQILPRLYVSMLIPRLSRAPRSLAEKYDHVTRQLVVLGCMRSAGREMSNAI